MGEIRSWSAYEDVGLGIPNPRSVAAVPVTLEMLEKLRPKAEAAGLTPEEYLEQMIDEWNAEEFKKP
jgi:hypothetical protein